MAAAPRCSVIQRTSIAATPGGPQVFLATFTAPKLTFGRPELQTSDTQLFGTETIPPCTLAQLQTACTFSSQSVLFGSVPKLFLTESKFFSILVIEFLWIL